MSTLTGLPLLPVQSIGVLGRTRRGCGSSGTP